MYENFMSYNEIVTNEPTNREILEAVNTIAVAGRETSEKVDGLSTKFEGLSEKVDGLSTKFEGLSETVADLVITGRETSEKVDGLSETVREVLEAVNEFATVTDKRFNSLETRMAKTEALMVTKDYLDDKLAVLRGDVLHVIRKEDTRVTRLIEILHGKALITMEDVSILERMQPLASVS